MFAPGNVTIDHNNSRGSSAIVAPLSAILTIDISFLGYAGVSKEPYFSASGIGLGSSPIVSEGSGKHVYAISASRS
ncbi:LOW QUALITY PROTEIN: hypothetical protein V1478_012022 [Vespula squamosa]|uniref:Uncharacterized protein n=1 Tax=Vespula squamosa TaxID=30214 RepID=A0ABD2ACN6_VESSQ